MGKLRDETSFVKGFWWRPSPGSNVDNALNDMTDLGVTDVWVWWEPYFDRIEEWRQLCSAVQARGIRFHTWVTVNHHYAAWGKADLEQHPDWAAVNHAGESTLDRPFAGFQYWYCPSAREHWELEVSRWAIAAAGTDGLHLDYIRFPDGFRFGESPAVSRKEVVEQSYCYCERCRRMFFEEHGMDPLSLAFDISSEAFAKWQAWRRRQVIEEVQYFSHWHQHTYPEQSLTAAVFPTPQIARDNVQQDWAKFSVALDGVCPMIYAKDFWEQPVSWVERAVTLGRHELDNGCKLIAGIGLLQSFTPGEIETAVAASVKAGANGMVCFLYPFEHPWQHAELKQAWSGL
ncbi:MAG: hypothetical protein K6T83_02580 [Alicyclobacillus sp.]|nr:hypothetical protein [Alicyclobacillus sp.]